MSRSSLKSSQPQEYFLNWGLNFEDNFALVDERKKKAREQTLRRRFPTEYEKIQKQKTERKEDESQDGEGKKSKSQSFRRSKIMVKRLQKRTHVSSKVSLPITEPRPLPETSQPSGPDILGPEMEKVQAELQHESSDAWHDTLNEVRKILSKYSKGLKIPTKEDPSIALLIQNFTDTTIPQTPTQTLTSTSTSQSIENEDEDENSLSDDESTLATRVESWKCGDEDKDKDKDNENEDAEDKDKDSEDGSVEAVEDKDSEDEEGYVEDEDLEDTEDEEGYVEDEDRGEEDRGDNEDTETKPWPVLLDSHEVDPEELKRLEEEIMREKDKQVVTLGKHRRKLEKLEVAAMDAINKPQEKSAESNKVDLNLALPVLPEREVTIPVNIIRTEDLKDDVTFTEGGDVPIKITQAPVEKESRAPKPKLREIVKSRAIAREKAQSKDSSVAEVDNFLDDYLVELQCGENAVIKKRIEDYVPGDRKWGYILIDDYTQVRSPVFRNFNPRKFDRHLQQASRKIKFVNARPTHGDSERSDPGGSGNRYLPPPLKGLRTPVPTRFAGIWYANDNIPRLDVINVKRGDFYVVRSDGPCQVRLEGKNLEIDNGDTLNYDGENWTTNRA